LNVSWSPPPQDRSNGRILYYKISFVEEGRNFDEADTIQVWNVTDLAIEELRPFQKYQISVLAGTSIGDGPSSMQGETITKIFKFELSSKIKFLYSRMFNARRW
jgi:hypothetical protein